MRVYTKVVIDIETSRTLSEDFYEYGGPIVECKGGGSSTEYVQSPEARQIMELLMPAIQRMGLAGQYGGTVPEGASYEVSPAVPPGKFGGGTPAVTSPLQAGTLWDVGGYGLPSPYGIPDTAGMMPTAETMAGISPEVRAGVMAPYKEIEQQLLETLGASGGLGSARGGFSGQGAAGVGRYWGDVAPEYTKSLWNMVAPAQQAGWQAELARGITGYGAELGQAKDVWSQELAAKQFPFTAIPAMAGGAMPSPVTTAGGGKK